MINRIDHVCVAVRDADAAGQAFSRLLGRAPEIQDGLGSRRVWFRFPNVALEILGPTGDGPSGDSVRRRLKNVGEGLWQLCFRVDDLGEAVRELSRRGLPLEVVMYTRPLAVGDAEGVEVCLVTPRADRLSPPAEPAISTVEALEQLLVQVDKPDRATEIYGLRFGLEAQQHLQGSRGERQTLFRCGDAAIAVSPALTSSACAHQLNGLVWRVANVEAAAARLSTAGFEIFKPQSADHFGARAIGVRKPPANVATFLIEYDTVRESAAGGCLPRRDRAFEHRPHALRRS